MVGVVQLGRPHRRHHLADGTARLWDAQSGKELLRLKHQHAVDRALLSPDGRTVLTAKLAWSFVEGIVMDGTVCLWEAQSGKELLRLPQDRIFAVSFSPDGRTILTGSDDHHSGCGTPEAGRNCTASRMRLRC